MCSVKTLELVGAIWSHADSKRHHFRINTASLQISFSHPGALQPYGVSREAEEKSRRIARPSSSLCFVFTFPPLKGPKIADFAFGY